ncbi:2682_t:CDS:2, partial [Cetraspora pellucida]
MTVFRFYNSLYLTKNLTNRINKSSLSHLTWFPSKILFDTACIYQKISYTSFPSSKSQKSKKYLVFDNKTSFKDFLQITSATKTQNHDLYKKKDSNELIGIADQIPYLKNDIKTLGINTKYFIEVYGCQMNVNDTEILMSIMNSSGYQKTSRLEDADIVFLVTCAIRDKAENKIWHRLNVLKSMKKDQKPLIGVLGVKRLKTKLLDADKTVDIVCGPDAYRSIPHLLSLAVQTSQGIANVMLSADETYADIMPVRLHQDNVSASLSIERSRPLYPSIVEEVKTLSDRGVKEVVLLGQNVNSYRDTSEYDFYKSLGLGNQLSNDGFKTIYRRKEGGIRFTELLDHVSKIDPEMRIRFISPHPKDFPTDLLKLIAERPNICNQIHLPVQSGNTKIDSINCISILISMSTTNVDIDKLFRYLDLVNTIRDIIPNVSISTDIITGFCGETEEEHQDTISLMEIVKFDMAYMFAYSMREKTHAHRNYLDDVPGNVKTRRLNEVIQTFHKNAKIKLNTLLGNPQLVLVEGISNRHNERFRGRTDGGHKIYFDNVQVLKCIDDQMLNRSDNCKVLDTDNQKIDVKIGDYVIVVPTSTTGATLYGIPLAKSSIAHF